MTYVVDILQGELSKLGVNSGLNRHDLGLLGFKLPDGFMEIRFPGITELFPKVRFSRETTFTTDKKVVIVSGVSVFARLGNMASITFDEVKPGLTIKCRRV